MTPIKISIIDKKRKKRSATLFKMGFRSCICELSSYKLEHLSKIRFSYQLTYDSAIAEEELMELTGEGGEEAAEGGDEAAQHGCEAGGVPLAHCNGDGREEQGERGRQTP